MKRYCLPSTFEEECLPTIPADCQAVLFALLKHSNNTMKAVWPSLTTLARLSGTKSEKTVRAKIQILESMGVITKKSVPSHRATKNKKQYTVFQIKSNRCHGITIFNTIVYNFITQRLFHEFRKSMKL